MVLSIMAYSLSASAARCWKIRFQTLDLALREKRVWILIGSPNRSGRSGRRAAAVPCGRQSPGDAARRVRRNHRLPSSVVATRRRLRTIPFSTERPF